jgi:D-cysteine desulfhydrase
MQFVNTNVGVSASVNNFFGSQYAFLAPVWLNQPGGVQVDKIPSRKISLGRFPTPLQKVQSISFPGFEPFEELELWVKRDDLTSFDLSGNKVRKLEFLLADALEKGHDSVITIGGVQSNHARATAVAARQIGLEPHLILRQGSGVKADAPLDLTGNLLFNRMVDAKIHTVTLSTYAQHGSEALGEKLAAQLKEEGKNPYIIPVGGSNALGAFGYIDCVREILDHNMHFDHIVFACGSGGTVAGLAIGMKLAGMTDKTTLHAVGVCDSPDYFYNHIEEVATELGIDTSEEGHGSVRSWVKIYAGQGIGYAKSTEEELAYLFAVSQQTGIIVDPVYSGKALYHFVNRVMKENPADFPVKSKILFIHTGGVLGLYDKESQLLPLLPPTQVTPLKLYDHR